MIFLLIILIVVTILLVGAAFIKDRRDTKRKTVESMGDDLWSEIDRERQESVEKGKRFRKMLDKQMDIQNTKSKIKK